MSDKLKNSIILFLIAIVFFLMWVIYDLSYGRYCRPIIKELDYPEEKVNNPDSIIPK